MDISKISIALNSPAFWAVAGTAIYNVLEALAPVLPPNWTPYISAALLIIAAVLHPKEVKTALMATPPRA